MIIDSHHYETALQQFDGRLIDGLEFCGKAYALFDDICREPTGRELIRMRSHKVAKLLVGELLPICRYVQTCYRLGRYISVRWMDVNQSYDAEMFAGIETFSGGTGRFSDASGTSNVEGSASAMSLTGASPDVRVKGHTTLPQDLDLRTTRIALNRIVRESAGAEELINDTRGNAFAPLSLAQVEDWLCIMDRDGNVTALRPAGAPTFGTP